MDGIGAELEAAGLRAFRDAYAEILERMAEAAEERVAALSDTAPLS